jgi:hypothetical protein
MEKGVSEKAQAIKSNLKQSVIAVYQSTFLNTSKESGEACRFSRMFSIL